MRATRARKRGTQRGTRLPTKRRFNEPRFKSDAAVARSPAPNTSDPRQPLRGPRRRRSWSRGSLVAARRATTTGIDAELGAVRWRTSSPASTTSHGAPRGDVDAGGVNIAPRPQRLRASLGSKRLSGGAPASASGRARRGSTRACCSPPPDPSPKSEQGVSAIAWRSRRAAQRPAGPALGEI